jgi:colanic acid/amylovoran biosynthesis glycosyltransferase
MTRTQAAPKPNEAFLAGLRVASALPSFPTLTQTFIVRQLTGLIDLGHDVHVLSDMPSKDEVVHGSVIDYGLVGRTTYALGGREKEKLSDVLALMGRVWKRPGVTPRVRALRRLRGSAGRRRFQALSELGNVDVLHCHFGPEGMKYDAFARVLGIPLIVSFYGFDCSRFPLQRGRDVYLPLFRSAAAVTVLSDRMAERVAELGCPPSIIVKQPLGVDLDEFPFQQRGCPGAGESIRIVSVARLVEKKGLTYALDAVAGVLRRHPQKLGSLRYDIIGDGPLRHALEQQATELGLKDTVRFLGNKTQDEVRRALAEAHVFMLPSVTAEDGDEEGTPTVLIEASATGLPVVSTLHSGIPELVLDGRSGFLAAERDSLDLTNKLDALIERPEDWGKFGREGRRHVEQNFDIRALNRRLAALYHRCRNGRDRSAT